ncbi:MAG: NAD(P)/FAD-dependent oxidoreductase [Chitinophagales bacterium]|nr:FAD-dependent monooxygenase [Chitinophagales bacterium]MDW8273923.1 NAD(P)/FAD-dependent oxidoreductase [Chitinophagales bacterium]
MKCRVVIAGGGLVGSLLACYLAKRNMDVTVIEKRADSRNVGYTGGRSINLALSNRGWAALEKMGLKEQVSSIALPMKGRMIHQHSGEKNFLPYGKEGQCIYSVSRGKLNEILITAAENLGAHFRFKEVCMDVDFESTTLKVLHTDTGVSTSLSSDVVFAADGAYSELRYRMQRTYNFNLSITHEAHGYKELTIPPRNGKHVMENDVLHIWPRERFMMIALPNPDGTFTCTLFAPLQGENSFESLPDAEAVQNYFHMHFPDAVPLMPGLTDEFFKNPTGSLVTVKCYPWKVNNVCLIGDAAHAIVPFYGQGMNCGFEDVRILDELIDRYDSQWDLILGEFQKLRKPNADAIAELALYNFIEMRDLSGRPDFQLRMKIEKRIAEFFPDKFQTLYSMVTFNQTPYAEALRRGKKQSELLDKIMQLENVEHIWETEQVLDIARDWLSHHHEY